jgi:SpoIID/LytB domain protein
MSQWGAQAMAKRGASYREILAWIYPETTLVGSAAR